VADMTPLYIQRAQRGFTLVELMVAMATGLVISLVAAVAMLAVGLQFRFVGDSSAAQVNAQLALGVINDAGRNAGAGLFNNRQPICATFNAWSSGTIKSNGGALMPARITDGGSATAPDTIVFTAATGTGPLSGMPVLDAAAAGGSLVVSAGGLVNNGDLALVGVPASTTVPCTLFQVTATPTVGVACGGNAVQCATLARTSAGSTGYNPSNGTYTNTPQYGYASSGSVVGPAVVMRIGTGFQQTAFELMCGTLVQYNAFTTAASCTSTPLAFGNGVNAMVTQVVQMQAQYGVSATAGSDVVTSWVDASGGTWGAPSVADVQRIKAVRVVVVIRAKEPDASTVTAASCTNGGGVVNTGPCSFDDASAPVIDLSTTPVPAGKTWRHYRYRVQQAVIPLRNVIWSDS